MNEVFELIVTERQYQYLPMLSPMLWDETDLVFKHDAGETKAKFGVASVASFFHNKENFVRIVFNSNETRMSFQMRYL
jgi:hypothetical protein